MSTQKKIALIVGPTGHGKSHLITQYAVGKKPEEGHTIDSETTETESYDCQVNGEDVVMFDTPGLGDTRKRDQKFLTELVDVLQNNASGIHKVFFIMQVFETRFNSFLAICLSLIIRLVPDLKQKPSVLTIVLSKANQGNDAWSPEGLPAKIDQLKKKILADFQVSFDIIPAGKNNMQQFEQSIKNAQMDVFCQTDFMRKIQTQDTELKKALGDLEKVKQDNSSAQAQIGQLQTAKDQANNALQAAQQQQNANQQQIAQLQTASDQANKNAEDARTKNEAISQQITQLQTAYDTANKQNEESKQEMTKQITELREQLKNAQPVIHNNYYSDGDGGDDCIIL